MQAAKQGDGCCGRKGKTDGQADDLSSQMELSRETSFEVGNGGGNGVISAH